MNPKVTISINGRAYQAEKDQALLGALRGAGVEIPTLCHHDELEPVGACRLCLVEVTHPDWAGWRSLVTSCLYPLSEGLEVSTKSERVEASRRSVLALLLARAPGSPRLARLASQLGVQVDRLRSGARDDCILCGLCTRVCETFATAAVQTFGRGFEKHAGGIAGEAPEDCVGCGGCAEVCPTDQLSLDRVADGFTVQGRHFDVALAVVDASRCMGCGACEEACPFSVARVALSADGSLRAGIAEHHCRGCGACIGACPSGAITQRGYQWSTLVATTGGSCDSEVEVQP